MAALDNGLEQSKVQSIQDPTSRTSYSTWLKKSDENVEYSQLSSAISKIYTELEDVTHRDINYMEDLNIIHYNIGQGFGDHKDMFQEGSMEQKVANGGQRIVSAVFFLNDVEEGGELFFKNRELMLKPVIGDGLVWMNAENDDNAVHASLPVKQGNKWVAVTWVRNKLVP